MKLIAIFLIGLIVLSGCIGLKEGVEPLDAGLKDIDLVYVNNQPKNYLQIAYVSESEMGGFKDWINENEFGTFCQWVNSEKEFFCVFGVLSGNSDWQERMK